MGKRDFDLLDIVDAHCPVTRVSPHAVTLILLLFGAGMTLGNAIGGRLGDWKPLPTMLGGMALLVAIQLVFRFSAAAAIPAAITVFLWGVLVFVIIPSIQMQLMHAAHGAPRLASVLNQSAFNLGNASGAWVGGIAIEAGVDYAHLPLLGAALTVVGLGAVVLTAWQDRRSRRAVDGAAGGAAAACAAE